MLSFYNLLGKKTGQAIGTVDSEEYFGRTFNVDFVESWYKNLFRFDNKHNNLQVSLAKAAKDIQNGKIPNVVMLEPSTKPPIVSSFHDSDLFQLIGEWTSMSAVIEEKPRSHTVGGCTFLSLTPESKAEDISAWVNLVEGTHGKVNAQLIPKLIADPTCEVILAVADGKAVGGVMTHHYGSDMGCYLIAVDKSYRGKGIGSGLNLFAMDLGRQRHGSQQCHLEVVANRVSVAKRMGFSSSGSKLLAFSLQV